MTLSGYHKAVSTYKAFFPDFQYRSGHICELPHYGAMGEKPVPTYMQQIRLVYLQLCYIIPLYDSGVNFAR